MEHTTATGKDHGEATGETLVVAGPPATAIIVKGFYINPDEIAFAYNRAHPVDSIDKPVAGCWIEFKRKGTLFIPGLSVEGLGSLVSGAPF